MTLDYDALDRVARLIDASGNVLSFEHDKHGRIVLIEQVLDGGERRTLARYAYDDQGDLVRATDRYGNAWRYEYHRHLVTRYTDRTGRGVTLEWDGADADDNANAKCVREYADDGSLDIRLAWHPNIRLTYVTDALGQAYASRRAGIRVGRVQPPVGGACCRDIAAESVAVLL
ncbi:hypothetical protein FCJ57_04120 [Burkholderia diffusa]|nr:hypothetical protein [Burkholderia diffusa]